MQKTGPGFNVEENGYWRMDNRKERKPSFSQKIACFNIVIWNLRFLCDLMLVIWNLPLFWCLLFNTYLQVVNQHLLTFGLCIVLYP
jgi:hypothetical protein